MIKDVLLIYIDRWEFFLDLMWEHINISLIAITISSILGIFIGILISQFRKISSLILGIINFTYTIPAISMLGFLIPIWGIGNSNAIIALSIYGLLPMVRNTYIGITNIDKKIIEASIGMGSTELQSLYKVKFPLSMPVILSGFRNMVIMTISLTGIASFVGAGGLGVAIYRGITTNNSAMTIAGSIAVAGLALVIDFIIGRIEKFVYKRKKINKNVIISGILIFSIGLGTFIYFSMDKDGINIASKPMTEQLIISEIIGQLIEEKLDIKVKITKGVGGGTSNIHPALMKGDFDLYPEYTGTSWEFVLKEQGYLEEGEEGYNKLRNLYEEKFNLSYIGLYGFNNSYGLAIRKEISEKFNIKTYSDLSKLSSDLVYGGEYDFFEREDGYKGLSELYGFKFKDIVNIDVGLKYDAMNYKDIDVMNVFTTDGQISREDIVILDDDQKFFPKYYAGTVVRRDTLDEYPGLEEVLFMLEGRIDDREMSNLNYKVEIEKTDEKVVAREFLKEKGLIKVK